MSTYRRELDAFIAKAEGLILSTKKKRITARIQAIASQFETGVQDPENTLRVFNRLRKLATYVAAEGTSFATLEQVEKEVAEIYGNQSKNDTYYFSRRGTLTASSCDCDCDDCSDCSDCDCDSVEALLNPTLDEVESEMNALYGDQSKNDTFYPSRKAWYE